jgi:hypothetical protein
MSVIGMFHQLTRSSQQHGGRSFASIWVRAVGVVPFFNPSFPTVLAVLEDSHQTEFFQIN